MLKALVDQGAGEDINIQNTNGRTPLHEVNKNFNNVLLFVYYSF